MVFAIVVTYNRINQLKTLIKQLNNQTFTIDKIVVVNNNSNDGTKEWLEEQEGIYIISQENLGGSGGFHTGVKYAFEQGADWLWLMDDDVLPKKDCLEMLLKYKNISKCLHPIHFDVDGTMLDEERWFDPASCNIVSNFNASYKGAKEIWYRNTGSFEGMLIASEIVQKIGFPDKRFFITHDDLIYAFLANKYTNVSVIRDAVMHKMLVVRSENSNYAYLYYSNRNYWLIEEYVAKELAGFNGYRRRRILGAFFYKMYEILRNNDYTSKRKALFTLYKAYKDFLKKKTGASF